MVLGIILLVVTILSVVSFIRQIRFKNIIALGFSAVAALAFGFFSIMTITCELLPGLSMCGGA